MAAQSIRDDLLGENLCPDNLCLDNLSNLSNLAQTCRSASVTLVTAECVERAWLSLVAELREIEGEPPTFGMKV
jgi:hypothetical protein